MDRKPYVYVTFEFDSIGLTEEEVWSGGDMPDLPTAEDVAALVKDQGGLHRVVRDWDLIHGARVMVVTTDVDNNSTTTYADL